MSTKSQIKIRKQDIRFIYGDDYLFFKDKILLNCHCSKCNTPYSSTIVNYEIFLNDLNDIILKGFCSDCGHPMNRYLETGEVAEYLFRIKQIRKKYSN